VTREPFSDDENELDSGRRWLRHALAVLVPVRDETIASGQARTAVATAVTSPSTALGPLRPLRRDLDQLADDAARETLPLRGGLVLGTGAEPNGARLFDEVTPPATDETPPLCGCGPRDACTHRRY
jgi:hypothetical protein